MSSTFYCNETSNTGKLEKVEISMNRSDQQIYV